MHPALLSLIAASAALVGSHFLLSHPLRALITRRTGERAFLGLYSLVALACLWWMARAFRAAPAADLPGSGAGGWILASALTIVALVLVLGSLRGNPAMPDPAHQVAIPRRPKGVFAVTRHPMLWGFALWAVAHLLLAWSLRTTIVAMAILLLSLLGAHLQDWKKERLLGSAWDDWEAKTSYWPRLWLLPRAGPALWLGALALWLGATWLHRPIGGIAAGLWTYL